MVSDKESKWLYTILCLSWSCEPQCEKIESTVCLNCGCAFCCSKMQLELVKEQSACRSCCVGEGTNAERDLREMDLEVNQGMAVSKKK